MLFCAMRCSVSKQSNSSFEKNGGDCYSKTEQTVTVLMAQN